MLEWDDLNCHFTSKKKQKKSKSEKAGETDGSASSGSKQILHNLTGQASPGRCGGVGSCEVTVAGGCRWLWQPR